MPHVARDSTATPQQVWDVLADGWLFSSWEVVASRNRESLKRLALLAEGRAA